MSVDAPILTTSTSPAAISSYSFDRPIPVSCTATGIRTVNGSSGSCGVSGMAAFLGRARGMNFAFVRWISCAPYCLKRRQLSIAASAPGYSSQPSADKQAAGKWGTGREACGGCSASRPNFIKAGHFVPIAGKRCLAAFRWLRNTIGGIGKAARFGLFWRAR